MAEYERLYIVIGTVELEFARVSVWIVAPNPEGIVSASGQESEASTQTVTCEQDFAWDATASCT